MPKAEWGTKRACQSCGARFYDFGRTPAVCPSCGTVFDTEVLSRTRRSRPGSRAVVLDDEEVPAKAVAAVDPDLEVEEADEAQETEEEEEAVEAEEGGDEEEEGLIEDASELGEDDELSDVIDGDIDEEPR